MDVNDGKRKKFVLMINKEKYFDKRHVMTIIDKNNEIINDVVGKLNEKMKLLTK